MDDIQHIALVSQRLAACVLYAIDGTCMHSLSSDAFSHIVFQAGLGRDYEIRIYVGYALVAVSYIVVIFNLFFGCHPFRRYWQISPDPGSKQPLHQNSLAIANWPLVVQMSVSQLSQIRLYGSSMASMSPQTCICFRFRSQCFGNRASSPGKSLA